MKFRLQAIRIISLYILTFSRLIDRLIVIRQLAMKSANMLCTYMACDLEFNLNPKSIIVNSRSLDSQRNYTAVESLARLALSRWCW
jgi:hypothetical protein